MVGRHTKSIHCASCKPRLPVSLWAWTCDLESSGPHFQSMCYAKLLKNMVESKYGCFSFAYSFFWQFQSWSFLFMFFSYIHSINVLFLYSADTSDYFWVGRTSVQMKSPLYLYIPYMLFFALSVNPSKCRKTKFSPYGFFWFSTFIWGVTSSHGEGS